MSEESGNIVPTFFKTFSGVNSSEKDVEEFRNRVSSYVDGQKWVKRPLCLSPAVCSRYGWKCINSNMLQCVTCGSRLCAPDPKIEMYNSYKECIDKILKSLSSSHEQYCPWPLTPLPESFIKMIKMPKEESLKYFMGRVKSSLEVQSSFPQITDSMKTQLGLDDQHVSSLCKLAEIAVADAQQFGVSLVSMAATGWSLKCEGKTEKKVFISCENCQRSMWSGSFNLLKMTRTNDQSESSSESLGDQNGSKETDDSSFIHKRFKKDDFNPLEEHRPWCLWVMNGDEELNLTSNDGDPIVAENNSEASEPGWKIFIKSLLRNVSQPQDLDAEKHPSKELIRSVRNLLESWTEAAV